MNNAIPRPIAEFIDVTAHVFSSSQRLRLSSKFLKVYVAGIGSKLHSVSNRRCQSWIERVGLCSISIESGSTVLIHASQKAMRFVASFNCFCRLEERRSLESVRIHARFAASCPTLLCHMCRDGWLVFDDFKASALMTLRNFASRENSAP